MLLAGDIGGTNTRLGLFASGASRPVPVDVRAYATDGFPSLESMIARFLADARTDRAAIDGAAFGVAGPVVHGRASLTNASWVIEADAVAAALDLPGVRLLNDLLAMAHAILVVEPGELHTLQPGEPNPEGNVSLIAPGTGLGEAMLIRTGGRLVPSPSEGGHADFAPRTTREVGLLAYLIEQYGRAGYERVI